MSFLYWPRAYPTHSHLHDGIKAPLRGVQISRDVLLAHQGVELLAVTGQLQDILVAEWTGAVLVACAWVQQLGRRGADVRHDCLLHKGTKTLEQRVDSDSNKSVDKAEQGDGLKVGF